MDVIGAGLSDFIATYPVPTAIIGVVVVLVAVVLLSVAFSQGREFQLGPLRIGPKQTDAKQPGESAAQPESARVPGKRLFQHKDFYPVSLEPGSNLPSLNPDIFVRAITYLLHSCEDRLAAMDLVYLREDNKDYFGDVLPTDMHDAYAKLIEKYDLATFQNTYAIESQKLFANVTRIVDELGQTLSGVGFEVLLHDVRNPLRSIKAAANSKEVSRRHLYGPSTRFVVQYLKHQGQHLIQAMESGNKVAYPKQFDKTKQVKATTTPIYCEKYGLIGILCFNIDRDAIAALDADGIETFFTNYTATWGETPEFEKDDAPDPSG